MTAKATPRQASPGVVHAARGLLIASSILQAALFIPSLASTSFAIPGIVLAMTGLIGVLVARSRGAPMLRETAAMCIAQAALFAGFLVRSVPRDQVRLAAVALILLYAASVVVLALVALAHIPLRRAVMAAGAGAGILFAAEVVAGWPGDMRAFRGGPAGRAPRPAIRWEGELEPDRVLGSVPRPNSTMTAFYPDNPRRYFARDIPRDLRWKIRADGDNDAVLEFPPGDPELVRVAVRRAASKNRYDIQLNEAGLTIKAGRRYRLSFLARASAPRTIALGVALGRAPWTNLGLYAEPPIGTSWKEFAEGFEAKADEDSARVHFDLGVTAGSIELDSVVVRELPDGIAVEPDYAATKYWVRYRFNDVGCRGPDYAIPKPAGIVRIVVLGDGFAMGAGVHEGDTFAARLTRWLNEKAKADTVPRTYEVINCGVGGYSTRDQRYFYERVTSRYRPDAVLLAMTWDDDVSAHEIGRETAPQRGRAESISALWRAARGGAGAAPDFGASVDQILQLDRFARRQSARVLAAVFRTACDQDGPQNIARKWSALASTVSRGLEGTSVAFLDSHVSPARLTGNPSARCSPELYARMLVHGVNAADPLDDHPNERVHAAFAEDVGAFIRRQILAPR